MKRMIFMRIAVCALAIGLSTGVYAQTDDDDMEETTTIKKPKRSEVKQKVYPMMSVKGVVTDQATGKPLAGVQLRSLANNRYTAMTNENGAFTISVPTFTTALYVHAPEYLSQQVAIKSDEDGRLGDQRSARHIRLDQHVAGGSEADRIGHFNRLVNGEIFLRGNGEIVRAHRGRDVDRSAA